MNSDDEAPNRARVAVPGHDHLVRFFGMRLRLVAAILAAGVIGGGAGGAYVWVLSLVDDAIGPDRWTDLGQIAVLVAVGLAMTALVRVLGRPADVELLVDNIHVPDGDDDKGARLRSLIPISLLCIGAGGTLGPEAPIATMSGSYASRIAHRAGLAPTEIRIVTISGLAAGFTVLFGAPLGAALFALEIPHRRGAEYHEALVPAAIGSAFGFVMSTALGGVGLEPIWSFPSVARIDLGDLGWAVLAGVLGAALAVGFTLVTRLCRYLSARIAAPARPAIGGLAIGVLALWSPYALTNGELQIQAIGGSVVVGTLLVAAAAKLIAAAVATATGWRGGFIIPLFFVGFCVGRVLGPELPGASEWAFVAGMMAATNTGVTKTPLGSTLVVNEMAGVVMLPTTLVAALTSMVLTSSFGLLESQRTRVDAYGDRRER